jgi:hypothetical protein
MALKFGHFEKCITVTLGVLDVALEKNREDNLERLCKK